MDAPRCPGFVHAGKGALVLSYYRPSQHHRRLLFLPQYTIAGDNNCTWEDLEQFFQELLDGDFLQYDEDAGVILIPHMYRLDPLKIGKKGIDNRVSGLLNYLEDLPDTNLLVPFLEIVQAASDPEIFDEINKKLGSPFEAPSKPLKRGSLEAPSKQQPQPQPQPHSHLQPPDPSSLTRAVLKKEPRKTKATPEQQQMALELLGQIFHDGKPINANTQRELAEHHAEAVLRQAPRFIAAMDSEKLKTTIKQPLNFFVESVRNDTETNYRDDQT